MALAEEFRNGSDIESDRYRATQDAIYGLASGRAVSSVRFGSSPVDEPPEVDPPSPIFTDAGPGGDGLLDGAQFADAGKDLARKLGGKLVTTFSDGRQLIQTANGPVLVDGDQANALQSRQPGGPDAFTSAIQGNIRRTRGELSSDQSWWGKSLGTQDAVDEFIHDNVQNEAVAGGLRLLNKLFTPDTPVDYAVMAGSVFFPPLRGAPAEARALHLGETTENLGYRIGETPSLSALTSSVPPSSTSSVSKEYGVAFFGSDNLRYYTRDAATLGRENSSFFLMPLEDSAIVQSAADAARYSRARAFCGTCLFC